MNFKILQYKELESTNDKANEIIDDENDFCNKVIFTFYQSKGRGAGSNSWYSSAGKNLLFSIIICPEIEVRQQFFISKLTSLAIIEYFKQKSISAKIKWPNDTLVNNKKISGILIENSITGNKLNSSIIGIGLNLNETVFPETLHATSVKLEKQKEFELLKELNNFLKIYEKRFNLCKNKSFALLDKEYFENLYGTDKYLTYKDKEDIFEAIVKGIDNYGRLILKDTTGKERIYMFKEVELLNYE